VGKGEIMDRLTKVRPQQYEGLNYKQLSDRMQEVCRIAAETGQTSLARKHLEALEKEQSKISHLPKFLS